MSTINDDSKHGRNIAIIIITRNSKQRRAAAITIIVHYRDNSDFNTASTSCIIALLHEQIEDLGGGLV